MSDAFQDRENTFEHVRQRRDPALQGDRPAQQGARALDRRPERAGRRGRGIRRDFVGAQIGKSDDEVVAALKPRELARDGLEMSDHRLQKRLIEEAAKALEAVRAGK